MSDTELPSKGSSSSTSNRRLLHGLFIGVDVRNGCAVVKASVEVPTPKSVQDTVFCVSSSDFSTVCLCGGLLKCLGVCGNSGIGPFRGCCLGFLSAAQQLTHKPTVVFLFWAPFGTTLVPD